MTVQNKTTLKGYFETGDQPTQAQFTDLVDTIGVVGLTVAASGAPTASLGRADYFCDGADDDVQIQAAIDALPATGGTVWLTEGSFTLGATVNVNKAGVYIRGASKNATKIFVGATDGFSATSGVDGVSLFARFSDFWMVLPAGSASCGIALVQARSNHVNIERIRFTGGNAGAWCIRADGSNVVKIDSVTMAVNSNGIIWQNAISDAVNYGDSLIINTDITMTANSLTGYKLVGPDASIRMINNFLLSRVTSVGNGAANGCVGIHIRNAARITLENVDLENLGTGVLHESAQGGGVTNNANAFIQVFALNCGTDLTEIGASTATTILGGFGDFQTGQKIAGTAFP